MVGKKRLEQKKGLEQNMKIRFDFIIKILDFIHDILCPFFKDNNYPFDKEEEKTEVKTDSAETVTEETK